MAKNTNLGHTPTTTSAKILNQNSEGTQTLANPCFGSSLLRLGYEMACERVIQRKVGTYVDSAVRVGVRRYGRDERESIEKEEDVLVRLALVNKREKTSILYCDGTRGNKYMRARYLFKL